MTNEDLVAIEQHGYIDDAFGSLGIVKSPPKLADNGDITIDCDGVDKGDSEIIVGRIACRMGRKGWNVDVWFDEESNVIRINYKENER